MKWKIDLPMPKVCSKCNMIVCDTNKSLLCNTCFNIEYLKVYGQRDYVKKKRSEYAKRYRAKNPEKCRQFHKTYYKNNIAKVLVMQKKYYASHKKERAEYCRKYYQRNKERIKAYQRNRKAYIGKVI